MFSHSKLQRSKYPAGKDLVPVGEKAICDFRKLYRKWRWNYNFCAFFKTYRSRSSQISMGHSFLRENWAN